MSTKEKLTKMAVAVVGKKPTNNPENFNALATRLAQGAAVVTGLLAFLGITQGQLDRLLRNSPEIAVIFLSLVGVGVLVGIAVLSFDEVPRRFALIALGLLSLAVVGSLRGYWLYATEPGEPWRWVALATAAGVVLIALICWTLPGRGLVLIAGVIVFLIGVAGLAVISVESKAAKDRPRIEAALVRSETGWTIEGKVFAQGLSSDEHVVISVEGMNYRIPLEGRQAGRIRDPNVAAVQIAKKPVDNDFYQNIAFMRVGPDSDGKIEVPIKAPITIGAYDRVRIAVKLETKLARRTEEEFKTLSDNFYDEQQKGSNVDSLGVVNARKALDDFTREHHVDTGSRCDILVRERSCLVIAIPQAAVRPTLDLTRAADGTASLTVNASDLNPDDVVEVLVSSDIGSVVYRARLSAGSTGTLTQPIVVTPLPGLHLCATGRILRAPALADVKVQPAQLPVGCAASWDVAYAELDP